MADPAPLTSEVVPLAASGWLPAYTWWPPHDEFAASAVLSTHASTTAEDGRYRVVMQGYAGGAEPLWQREVADLSAGDYQAVRVDELGVPAPPSADGGILIVHTLRIDAEPLGNRRLLWQWMDVQGKHGGGYQIPCVAFRGAKKKVRRDDLQVIPGVVANRDVDTELLLLNPIPGETSVRLVLASAAGLTSEADIALGPWSAWRRSLSEVIPRAGRLLKDTDGIGSIAIYSSHKVMPFFGLRKGGGPVSSMDHSAPIFA